MSESIDFAHLCDLKDAEIAALKQALTDYIKQTGIGSTLLPDVVPPPRRMGNRRSP